MHGDVCVSVCETGDSDRQVYSSKKGNGNGARVVGMDHVGKERGVGGKGKTAQDRDCRYKLNA